MAIWLNWIERLPTEQEVPGSSPGLVKNAHIAQLVEHRSYEPKVSGSSPGLSKKRIQHIKIKNKIK